MEDTRPCLLPAINVYIDCDEGHNPAVDQNHALLTVVGERMRVDRNHAPLAFAALGWRVGSSSDANCINRGSLLLSFGVLTDP